MSGCSKVRPSKDWVRINIKVERGRPFWGKESFDFYGTAEESVRWLDEMKPKLYQSDITL